MSRRLRARLVSRAALCVVLALFGCASSAPITGAFDDYAAYRRARLAMTREERLGASFDYLQSFPRGDYRAEVREWFLPAEERYFRLAHDNPQRLRAYLQMMPRGPHAEQVSQRLAELETRRVFAERREARALSHARSVQSALADADVARRKLIAEWLGLLRLLAGVRSFGEPTSALASDLIWQFRLREPQGHCELDHCSKRFHFEYAVPSDKQLVPRSADFELTFELERGELRSVALGGRRMFNRVSEAVEVRTLGDEAEDRRLAVERVVELARNALATAFPEASCAEPSTAPSWLVRRCDGVRFELTTDGDGTDVARISADVRR